MGTPEVTIPIGLFLEKELTVKGSFRYGAGDYPTAIQLVASGKVDVKPLITHRLVLAIIFIALTMTPDLVASADSHSRRPSKLSIPAGQEVTNSGEETAFCESKEKTHCHQTRIVVNEAHARHTDTLQTQPKLGSQSEAQDQVALTHKTIMIGINILGRIRLRSTLVSGSKTA